MLKFKERLKELRKYKGLTQKQLSKEICVSEDSIYNWESGRSEPSLVDLINLSKVLNVTTDYLLGNSDI